MTEHDDFAIPSMAAAYRFMASNPATSWEMLVEILGLGAEDKAAVSGGRFRELWMQSGGAVDRQGNAWVEMAILPSVLRKIIDAVAKLPQSPKDTP